jgi:RNA polymerase sigma factor (sigma-70 family)
VAIRLTASVSRQFRTLYNLGTIGELTDGQLLERFSARDGEAAELAFAALVERHGAMVWRVCRKALNDSHDAQDAFQATFLVLVQKARSLWVADSLAPWLHRVANRVAARARASMVRRREQERRAAEDKPGLILGESDRADLAAVIHQEIDRLAERYRLPVILCDLEGLSHDRAARHLGWPVGTVKSRLMRARELLRGRLSRRGLGLPAGLLIAEAASGLAEAALSSPLVEFTTRTVVSIMPGGVPAVGGTSARVALLAKEVVKAMLLSKMKLVVGVVFIGGALALGASGLLAQQETRPVERPEGDQSIRSASGTAGKAAGTDTPAAPAYIRQSRTMIITRLEQELAVARERLDRTLRTARSPDDPVVIRARKTVEALENLLIKIDGVLVGAVDQYPTLFDFSGAPTAKVPPPVPGGNSIRETRELGTRQDSSAASSYDENDLARARDRVKWASSMFQKGYVAKEQLDREIQHYEALRARIEADIATGQERVDWAQRMMDKGYVSKEQYESELFKHYKALKARMWEDSSLSEVLRDYERLKSRFDDKTMRRDPREQDKDSKAQRKGDSTNPGAPRVEIKP